jgi:membrane protease YdiL (CAAX protease family)
MRPAPSPADPLALAEPPARLQAFLRFIAFLALAAGLTGGGLFAISKTFRLQVDLDHPSLGIALAGQVALVLLSAVFPALLVRLATREGVASFGWGRPPRRRQLLMGAAGGFVLMTLLIAAIAAFGGLRFDAPALPPLAIVGYGLGYAALFSLVAISEEGLLRAYALIQLSRAISFWPAALVTSLLFVAMHLGHRNETAMGLAQVGLFGLLMALSVRQTGGLWFALGFHAAWDFTETFVYGVPDSGMASAGSLIVSRFVGAGWLTGGSAGPEGSALVFAVLALLAGWIWFGLRPRDPSAT